MTRRVKHRKYASWGEFLKRFRERGFRSAREFCTRMEVGISYPQYSRYEAGEQLPPLEQALDLCRKLGASRLEGLLEWNLAQLPETELRTDVLTLLKRVQEGGGAVNALMQPLSPKLSPHGGAGASLLSSGVVELDDVIVFNRSHLKLFSSDPAYRDLFTYINSFSPEWVSLDELSQALSLPLKRIHKMLDDLRDLGAVVVMEGACRASKRVFYFPDDADFFPLRNMNFEHNVNTIMGKVTHDDLAARRAYRGLVTRELTAKQLDALLSDIESLMLKVVDNPESSSPDKIYSFCTLVGERFARPASYRTLGLTTSVKSSNQALISKSSEPTVTASQSSKGN